MTCEKILRMSSFHSCLVHIIVSEPLLPLGPWLLHLWSQSTEECALSYRHHWWKTMILIVWLVFNGALNLFCSSTMYFELHGSLRLTLAFCSKPHDMKIRTPSTNKQVTMYSQTCCFQYPSLDAWSSHTVSSESLYWSAKNWPKTRPFKQIQVELQHYSVVLAHALFRIVYTWLCRHKRRRTGTKAIPSRVSSSHVGKSDHWLRLKHPLLVCVTLAQWLQWWHLYEPLGTGAHPDWLVI